MDRTDVPRVLRLMQKHDLEFELDPGSASYFLSEVELTPGDDESLARWRKHLFLALATSPRTRRSTSTCRASERS